MSSSEHQTKSVCNCSSLHQHLIKFNMFGILVLGCQTVFPPNFKNGIKIWDSFEYDMPCGGKIYYLTSWRPLKEVIMCVSQLQAVHPILCFTWFGLYLLCFCFCFVCFVLSVCFLCFHSRQHILILVLGGTWSFTHIDDLKDDQPNRPVIAHLKDRSVGSLLKKDQDQIVDTTMLMKDSFLDAMSRVSDSVQCGHLGAPRRKLISELLKEGTPNGKGASCTIILILCLSFIQK